MTRKRLALLAVACAALVTTVFFALAKETRTEAINWFGQTTHLYAVHDADAGAAGGCDRDMPGCAVRDEPGADANAAADYWNERVTYPTGNYNPLWLRRAAAQAAKVPVAVPAGHLGHFVHVSAGRNAGLAPITTSFAALGPAPELMTGCGGCFNYTRTEGRVNSIVVDPTTTTNGSIVAYLASDGGGVWKTTNCCSANTTWSVTTDNPLISDISIDALAIDPNNHNTIYAGTGDLNFGSFSMGSQGILKSTDGGATWTVLGASVFGDAYTEPSGNYPQYDAVGKIAVDPNNSSNVVAGTKKGLFFSYDGGNNWTGPCLPDSFTSQRQDITGLVLSDMGLGVTRIIAAVGTRGFATPVQYDLGSQGANGIYSANMQASGCPSFASIAGNSNGFVYGTTLTGSPYATGANLNLGSGTPYSSATVGDQASRIDIAVAPSNPNVIYAQVGSIAPNTETGGGSSTCGGNPGCQLGAFVSTNGGTSWSMMAGSAGPALKTCNSSGASPSTRSGDYNQNWYDQGVAVDPNNADRVYFDTFEVWMATRTGTAWYDLSCAYTQSTALGMHADEHALAFVPGSSSMLLAGNDGGVDGTLNANGAVLNTTRPTWFNMDLGLNTIEYYNGDIWGGGPSTTFAASSAPWASGGAQDNMDSVAHFSTNPLAGGWAGPVQWQGQIGGDGFWSAIDGLGGYMYLSNNGGALSRCTANCATGGTFSGISSTPETTDAARISFAAPFDLFRGNIGGTGNAECTTRCNHMIYGTFRVWESLNTDAATGVTWTARTGDLTKATLGNRSYINQLHYAPQNQTLGIAATNDGNVQVLYGLGGTTTNVNITGNNAVLPNRPILDARLDQSVQNTAGQPFMGYAAVGGFNANTPSTPGHVFWFTCDVNCANVTWQNKSGNLPDIPVDSIQQNPNFPQQVFAGTDFGLYFTNDITAASPTWYRFQNGLPNVMIWTMQVDRGNSALSLWTRSRGAYVWALPTGAIKQAQTITFTGPLADKTYGDADFSVSATSDSGLAVTFIGSGACSVSGSIVHITSGGTCTVTAQQAGNIDYNAATDVPLSFNVAKASQSITFPNIADHTFGDPDFALSAFSSSGLDISYGASGNCTIVGGSSVHLTGAGSCTVTASQGGNASYLAATDVPQTFSIAQSSQTIDFTVADKTYGDPDFQITATATSGLTVSLTKVSGHCSLDSATSPANVHISGTGACVITASQGGNVDYLAADDVTRSFTIAKAAQSITFGPLSDKTWGDAPFDVSATASSGLDVTFTAQDDCTVVGNTVHLSNAGTCTITASQAGDDNYNPASDVQQSFTINKADQTIDFGTLSDKTYGDADFAVSASSSSGLDVSFSIKSGQCSLVAGQVHITGAGTCTVTASQPGNSNYNAATDVDQTFTIAKADQTIDFGPLPDKTYGDPDFDVSATSTSGEPVTFSTSGDCVLVFGKVDITGAGSCTVTASQSGDDNYNAATSVDQTFSIAKAGQTIDFALLHYTTPESGDFEISGTATSGLSVSLSASGPCTLSSHTSPASVHVTGTGTCSVTASQAGDSNYNAAPDVVRSFVSAGLVGLTGVSVSTTTGAIDSFNSSLGVYGGSNRGSSSLVLSNGAISLSGVLLSGDVLSTQGSVSVGAGGHVSGDATAGGAVSGGSRVGGTVTQSSPSPVIAVPSVAACHPFSRRTGISGGSFAYSATTGNLTVVSGTVKLADGTYCFNNVTLGTDTKLKVTGPVTIYLTGTLSAQNAKLINATDMPSNLRIYSSHVGGNGVGIAGANDAYMRIVAPKTTVTVAKGSFFGTIIAGTLKVSDVTTIHVDIH